MSSFSQNIKIRSARITSSCKLITAGVTLDAKTILFSSEDYDNKGNVNGIYQTIGDSTDKFYQATGQYSNESLRELGWTSEQMEETQKDVEHFQRVTKLF